MKIGYYLLRKRIGHGRYVREYVHRIVAKTFLPPPPSEDYEVSHLNDIKTDNRAENLVWMTHKENMNWGTSRIRIAKGLQGKHPSEETRKKLSEAHKGKPRPDVSSLFSTLKWFNNGTKNIRAKERPDESWVEGRLSYKHKKTISSSPNACQSNS